MQKRFAVLSLILAAAVTLSACANTVRGVGRDVNSTADAVQDSVQ
ncbi:entericidin A/B family lipoprotein [Consotaella salsifontis]|uniref:Predicted small secreted protein n=1 Tax=Consotaella salsifontis TaxID=1365950 RepID=A0A1T4LA00_9HYPH|nr:entericidin A/B family lipoprotein [Consotaella salsifontis]SJZ51464.1 Predicted small secreted protein [Consotaella salsifontis]